MVWANITFEVKNQVAYIGFGKYEEKSVVVLSKDTLTELNTALDELRSGQEYRELDGVIFFSHKKNCFIAGMDVNVISSLKSAEEASAGSAQGQEIFNKIEDLDLKTVALVDGTCMGGGFELALSCQYILCSDSNKTVFSLPEVQLGLIPGFGGTYRLPSRVSMADALDMILSGKQIRASKALKMGLVDEMYASARLMSMGQKFIKNPKQYLKLKKKNLKTTLTSLLQDNFLVKKIIFQKAREKVIKKTLGLFDAPLKILEVMEEGSGQGRASYLSLESKAFGELCLGDQSKNLRNLFFSIEKSKKFPGHASSYLNYPTQNPPKIKSSAILGAGTMGGGIAYLFADNNLNPLLKDINIEALELGLKQSSQIFYSSYKKKRLTRDEWERKQRSITPLLKYQGFNRADIVVEAIIENVEIKKSIFRDLENMVKSDCILCSNTSSLSITELASNLKNPERFLGLHFFNPVNKMPLIEIISHPKTSADTLERVYNLAVALKKFPVIVKDSPGFLVNRLLGPYITEMTYLLEEGVSVTDIDRASLDFGMPMGPCRLLDEIGIDVGFKVSDIFYKAFGDRFRKSDLADKILSLNLLGRKGGKGIYLYNEDGSESENEGEGVGNSAGTVDEKRSRDQSQSTQNTNNSSNSARADSSGSSGSSDDNTINPEIKEILPSKKTVFEPRIIQMRLLLPMINEAARVLEEGVVGDAASVDFGMIMGTGFPPYRGGPLKHADSEGLDKILQALKEFAENVSSSRYQPAPLLEQLVSSGKNFYNFNQSKA
ncbi:MAG: enoyl-CoA hydratase/isomerase family protein [Oligoflexia bacterium]|nr:enoyl-CoA hydratase/isomerase family protein [Oligoflexia bacterium]